jgi:hypothetical protein
VSNTPHKCPHCGIEVYVSLLGGIRVEYRTGYMHDCPKKVAHLSVVPPDEVEEPVSKPAKKG